MRVALTKIFHPRCSFDKYVLQNCNNTNLKFSPQVPWPFSPNLFPLLLSWSNVRSTTFVGKPVQLYMKKLLVFFRFFCSWFPRFDTNVPKKIGLVLSFSKNRLKGQSGTDVMIFLNIFTEKFSEKIGVLTRNKAKLCKILIITLFFWEKRQFFCQKLSKIAENCDHNIDPGHPAHQRPRYLPIHRFRFIDFILKCFEMVIDGRVRNNETSSRRKKVSFVRFPIQ
jgi:hypothetical protein